MNFPGDPGPIRSSLGKRFALLGLLLAAATPASADPLDEITGLSLFRRINLENLKNGQILVESGPVGEFPRGIYLESCYFIEAPVPAVGDFLFHWNPAAKQAAEVRQYRAYSPPPSAEDFRTLHLDRGMVDDRWLLDETARVAQSGSAEDLHLTAEEVEIIRQRPKDPDAAWREILRQRAESLNRGGLPAVAPYGTDRSISPASEFRGLLTLAPKAARHFQSILEAQPCRENGKTPSETIGFWESRKVHKHNTLQLGFFTAQKSDDAWQVLECIYYPSDTYYMSLNLFQLWPVEGGTLLWQVGFVSAPFRPYLGGIDRYVAGKLMTEKTINTIKAFRADLAKGRKQ